jgi:aspartyl-tRNA(Asn)/glutamyl-tRNA(Gln) amidotransferase subunit B
MALISSRVLMELGALLKSEEWSSTRVPPHELGSIIAYLLRKQITTRTAKLTLAMKFEGDSRSVDQIIADEDMILRPLSPEEYRNLAQGLLEEKADMVQDILARKHHKKIKWFVGQMMARSAEGTVEPDTAESVLRELLHLPPSEKV